MKGGVQVVLPVLVLGLGVVGPARAQSGGTWTETPAPASGGGGDWRPSLSKGPIVGSYLDAGKPRLLVAAAGKPSSTARPATDALVGGLRASGRARVVMDDSALGDLSGVDDREIVRRAFQLPIDLAAVVRVIPSGAAEVAVVTFYDRASKAVTGFTVERGAALEARSAPAQSANQGVASAATRAVDEVLQVEAPQRTAAHAEYDKAFVWFEETRAMSMYGTWDTTQTFLGKFRHPLEDDADFYEAVGRPEMAASFRKRYAAKIALLVVGFASLAVGTLGAGATYVFTSGESRDAALGMFIGGCSAGLIMVVTGGAIPSLHVDLPKRREMAAEHNARLRERLGLPPLGPGKISRRPSMPPPSLSLAPMLRHDGGGLSLRLVF